LLHWKALQIDLEKCHFGKLLLSDIYSLGSGAAQVFIWPFFGKILKFLFGYFYIFLNTKVFIWVFFGKIEAAIAIAVARMFGIKHSK